MSLVFIKPEIKFPPEPEVFVWIEARYKTIKTYTDYANFIHLCLNYYDKSVNVVKREIYMKLASALYAADTNISFESKNMEILANSKS